MLLPHKHNRKLHVRRTYAHTKQAETHPLAERVSPLSATAPPMRLITIVLFGSFQEYGGSADSGRW